MWQTIYAHCTTTVASLYTQIDILSWINRFCKRAQHSISTNSITQILGLEPLLLTTMSFGIHFCYLNISYIEKPCTERGFWCAVCEEDHNSPVVCKLLVFNADLPKKGGVRLCLLVSTKKIGEPRLQATRDMSK